MYTGSDTAVSRREHAYEALKTRLLEGTFAAGERLREERLANELGVSRTPIREALSRLHSDGLVVRVADGYTPVVPDLATIRDLYEVRFGLERWAVTRPLRGGPPHHHEQIVAFRAEWVELDRRADADFVLLDEDFHVRVAASAGNPSLVQHLQSVNERIRVVRVHDFLTDDRVDTTIEQHIDILDALLVRDIHAAEERLVRNFSESLAVVEERAAMAIARMVQRWQQ